MRVPKRVMTDHVPPSLFTGRSSEGPLRWGQRSLTPLQSVSHSLDVGLPSPRREGVEEGGGMGGLLFQLTDRPVCRAVLLTSVVAMVMVLTGIVIFLLAYGHF